MAELSSLQHRMLLMMAKHSMNMAQVGREMNYHPNAVAYHMDKIMRKTGNDPRTFEGLCRLLGYKREADNG